MKGYRVSLDKLFRSQLPKCPCELADFLYVQMVMWGLIPCALFRVSDLEPFNSLLIGGFGKWFHRVFVLTHVFVECQQEAFAYRWDGTGFDFQGLAYVDEQGRWQCQPIDGDPR